MTEIIHNKKEVNVISEKITVNDKTSELAVQINMNTQRGTYSITPKITQDHVHPHNELVRKALLDRIYLMTEAAITYASERRNQILNGHIDPEQSSIKLEEE